MTLNEKDRAKGRQSQRDKYGDGYSEEMARRGALRKTHATGASPVNYGGAEGLSEEMSRRAKIRWDKINAEKQNSTEIEGDTQSFDRTQEP
jgi:hypothetical protein